MPDRIAGIAEPEPPAANSGDSGNNVGGGATLVLALRRRAVTLTIEGARISVAPAAAISSAEQAMIREHKADVIRLVTFTGALDKVWNPLGRDADREACDVAVAALAQFARLIEDATGVQRAAT